jgi:hypothetical protein
MTYDDTGNMIDVIGSVQVTMTDKIGTMNQMNGDTAHLELIDVKPSKSVKSPKPATSPTTSEFGKELKSMLLQGRVHGQSELTGANGVMLRRAYVSGDKLTYDAASGKTEVPGPGWLEMEDHRPAKAGGGNRGKMAMQWKTSLLYDQLNHQIIVTGDTSTGFLKDAKDATPMRLASQRVILDLVPTKTTTAPTDAAFQLSHVRAEGQIVFDSKGTHFTGHSIDYDPAADELIARGNADESGRVYDDSRASIGSFDELVFNTKIQEVDRSRGIKVDIRR